MENFEEDNNLSEETIIKKKRGRKRKEDLLKADLEAQKRLEQEAMRKPELEIDPKYYANRTEYTNIVLAAFLTRYRNIKDASIKDNDNIIREGFDIIDEIKKMSDIEYSKVYILFLRHLNKEDIFLD